MAAAARLELVLRIVNVDTKGKQILASGGTPANIEARVAKEKANATKGTYGQVVNRFLSLHEGKVEPDVEAYLRDSIGFRNHMAHTFFQSHILNFMTAEGLELIRIECEHFIGYFHELEECIIENAEADFEAFMAGVLQTVAEAGPHPFAHLVKPTGGAADGQGVASEGGGVQWRL
ncbi:MAG TPA: hypothetical protein VGB79_01655 [Allosphingosinicella sp.]|jgi:hypothetical protein